jgi:hypothetical protein
VESEEDAKRLRFVGSPTVRVDGADVEPAAAAREDFALQCRVYQVDGRLEGAPPTSWIASALGADSPPAASGTLTSRAPCSCEHAEPRNARARKGDRLT